MFVQGKGHFIAVVGNRMNNNGSHGLRNGERLQGLVCIVQRPQIKGPCDNKAGNVNGQ